MFTSFYYSYIQNGFSGSKEKEVCNMLSFVRNVISVRIVMWSSSVEPKRVVVIVKNLRSFCFGCRSSWLRSIPFDLSFHTICWITLSLAVQLNKNEYVNRDRHFGNVPWDRLCMMHDCRCSMIFFPHSASGHMHRTHSMACSSLSPASQH